MSKYVRVPLLVKTPAPEYHPQEGVLDVEEPIIGLAQSYVQRQLGAGAVVGGAPTIVTDHGTSVLYASGLQVHVAMPMEAVAELLGVEISADVTAQRDEDHGTRAFRDEVRRLIGSAPATPPNS
jgi:hypothetical protein